MKCRSVGGIYEAASEHFIRNVDVRSRKMDLSEFDQDQIVMERRLESEQDQNCSSCGVLLFFSSQYL